MLLPNITSVLLGDYQIPCSETCVDIDVSQSAFTASEPDTKISQKKKRPADTSPCWLTSIGKETVEKGKNNDRQRKEGE